MTIEKVKKSLEVMQNKKILAKVDIGRNKYEYYEGQILDMYPNVFTFKVDNEIKSFSYSDILIKNIILKLL